MRINILGFVLCFFKAFWRAIIEIVWGIAAIVLLSGLLQYGNDVGNLTKIVGYILNNWGLFFFVLFIYEFMVSYQTFPNNTNTQTQRGNVEL
jgi:hypothetical protein